MKLRTGKPLWLAGKTEPLPVRRLSRDRTCDVAIIGAGITGALVAHQLLKTGLSVVMLDRRRAGFGSTAASTGLLMIQPDSSIAELTRRHGRRAAQRVYELGRKAIHELGALARELKIECGWQAKRSLYLASNRKGAVMLRREAKLAQKICFPVEQISQPRMRIKYGLPFPVALASAGAAQVHALHLTRGVLRHALTMPNFALFQNTRVASLREDAAGVNVRTDTGHTLSARCLIVAAGYESMDFVRSKLIRLSSTYVIASRPFPPDRLDVLRSLMWETARPYFYLRLSADHRIIFGGHDEPFDQVSSRERRLNRKTRQLEEQFAKLWPQLAFKADYAWSGTFADTTDGLPCIGPLKPNSRVLYALGYGGNGITFSQIAAPILRDACLGKPNPDARLFGFHRLREKRRS